MKSPFWIMFCNKVWFWWKKTRKNIKYCLLDWDAIRDFIVIPILLLLGLLGIFYVVGKESNMVSDKRKDEQGESFKMEYAGKKFYKFNLEGHEYWSIENDNQLGFCHSESCPCKTNKMEVLQ